MCFNFFWCSAFNPQRLWFEDHTARHERKIPAAAASSHSIRIVYYSRSNGAALWTSLLSFFFLLKKPFFLVFLTRSFFLPVLMLLFSLRFHNCLLSTCALALGDEMTEGHCTLCTLLWLPAWKTTCYTVLFVHEKCRNKYILIGFLHTLAEMDRLIFFFFSSNSWGRLYSSAFACKINSLALASVILFIKTFIFPNRSPDVPQQSSFYGSWWAAAPI